MPDTASTSLFVKLARILCGLHEPAQVAPLAELIQPLDTRDDCNQWALFLADSYPFPAEIRANGTPDSYFALPSSSASALLRALGLTEPRLQNQACAMVSAALRAQTQQTPLRFVPLDINPEQPNVLPGFILLSYRFASNLAQALIALFAPQQARTTRQHLHPQAVIDALHSAANPHTGRPSMTLMRNNWRAAQDLLAARKTLAAHLIIEYTQHHVPPRTDSAGSASELNLWNQYSELVHAATALLTGAPLSTVSALAQLQAESPSLPAAQPTPREWIQLLDSPPMQAWLQLAAFLPNSHLLDPLHLLAHASVLWLRDQNPHRLSDIEPLYLSLTS